MLSGVDPSAAEVEEVGNTVHKIERGFGEWCMDTWCGRQQETMVSGSYKTSNMVIYKKTDLPQYDNCVYPIFFFYEGCGHHVTDWSQSTLNLIIYDDNYKLTNLLSYVYFCMECV